MNGGYYPGTAQPVWWTSTGTTMTTNVTAWPGAVSPATKQRSPERPKTAVEWLRQRIAEVTALAPSSEPVA